LPSENRVRILGRIAASETREAKGEASPVSRDEDFRFPISAPSAYNMVQFHQYLHNKHATARNRPLLEELHDRGWLDDFKKGVVSWQLSL
jgi:hypothetical protein